MIEIRITGNTAAETAEEIKALAGVFGVLDLVRAADEPKEPAKKTSKKAEPKKTESVEEPKEEPKKDGAPVPTPEEVRAAVGAAVKRDAANKAKAKELLTEFGVENISSIPEEKRAEYVRAIEAL